MKFPGLIYTAGNVTEVLALNVVLEKANDDIPIETVLHLKKNYYPVGLVVLSVFYILCIAMPFFFLRQIAEEY